MDANARQSGSGRIARAPAGRDIPAWGTQFPAIGAAMLAMSPAVGDIYAMYKRNIEIRVREALRDTPVVFLNGARQTGKTTLVRHLARERGDTVYVTLDDAAVLAAVAHDPAGFIGRLDGPAVLDEVQKAPALFPALKASVDRDRRPGRFLLTGSADVMMLPAVSESLAGRMEILTLRPLSQGELEGVRETFIDRLFAGPAFRAVRVAPLGLGLEERIVRGGFPEAVRRIAARRRAAWFGSYLTAILQRDVRDLAMIERLTDMPHLLALLAARTAGLLNMAELSRGTGIPHTTMKRYLALLQTTFLVQFVPAWSANLGKRLVKSPKVLFCDTGLATHLRGVEIGGMVEDRSRFGPLLENFVGIELSKIASWSDLAVKVYHYRTSSGREIDFIVEDRCGCVVAIEVKASATVKSDDFSAIRGLADALGPRFVNGVVLYTGDQVVPFGDRLTAVPVPMLWGGPAAVHEAVDERSDTEP